MRKSGKNTIVGKLKKNCVKSILLAFSLFLFPFSLSYADFEDTGQGARGVAMGNASCALADDAFGIYYNPAGLGFVRQSQIGADYSRLFIGLDDESNLGTSFFSFVYPVFTTQIMTSDMAKKKLDLLAQRKTQKDQRAKEAILLKLRKNQPPSKTGQPEPAAQQGVVQSTAAARPSEEKKDAEDEEEQETKYFLSHWGTFAAGWKTFALQGFYQESAYYFSFGKTYKERLSYGLSVKMLSEKYTVDEYMKLSPVFKYGQKDSVSAYGIDAGVIYNVMPRFFVGISATDLNQPDLGLYQSDYLPSTLRIGAAWRQKDLKWAADAVSRNSQWYTALGLEKWFKDRFALRGGLNFGGKNYYSASFGFGFNFDAVGIDYAFSLPLTGVSDTMGSHRMSMVYRFGTKAKEDLEPGSLEYYYSNLEDEVAELKRSNADLKIEKRKLEQVLIDESMMRIKERIQAAKDNVKIAPKQGEEKVQQAVTTTERKEVSHLVRQGETLQSISRKYYKDERFWSKIYEANKENIGRGGVLKPNQVLIIPPLNYAVSGQGPESRDSMQKPVEPQAVKIEPVPVPVQVQVVPVTPAAAPVKPLQGSKPAEPAAKPADNKPAASEAKAPAKAGKKHTVQPGESLQSLAKKYYNDSGRWKEIYKANKDKVVGGQVSAGQELIIP